MKKFIVVHFDKKEIKRTVKKAADELYLKEEQMNSTEKILRETIKVLEDIVDIQKKTINTYKEILQEVQNGQQRHNCSNR